MYLYFFYFNKNHGATSFNLLSFHFYFYFFRSAASPTSLFVGSSSSFFISCFLVFWWFSCYFPYPVWIQECFVNKQVIPLNKKSGNTLFFIFFGGLYFHGLCIFCSVCSCFLCQLQLQSEYSACTFLLLSMCYTMIQFHIFQ